MTDHLALAKKLAVDPTTNLSHLNNYDQILVWSAAIMLMEKPDSVCEQP